MENTELIIPIGKEVRLRGNLSVPPGAKSLVIFSHGSGSSRFSPRNRFVAEKLNRDKMATLLIDLLTEPEDNFYGNRFNINLLTSRLTEVTFYVSRLKRLNWLPIAYFGASTGAASALQAAARLGKQVYAIVSRGGRPDMAEGLAEVKSPTMLIVGSLDKEVIGLNKMAFALLRCEKEIKIVEGAGHLFEEPGKLPEVASFASGWFKKHLPVKADHNIL